MINQYIVEKIRVGFAALENGAKSISLVQNSTAPFTTIKISDKTPKAKKGEKTKKRYIIQIDEI